MTTIKSFGQSSDLDLFKNREFLLDFRLNVYFAYTDNLLAGTKRTVADLETFVKTETQRKIFNQVKPFIDEVFEYQNRFKTYGILMVSEETFNKYFVTELWDLPNLKKRTFLQGVTMALGAYSAAIFYEKEERFVHCTRKELLPDILNSGKLEVRGDELSDFGDGIYCYALEQGQIADVGRDTALIFNYKGPWFRVVYYEDTGTIKPLGECILLNDAPLNGLAVYYDLEALRRDLNPTTVQHLLYLYGIDSNHGKQILKVAGDNLPNEAKNCILNNELSSSSYCYIPYILDAINRH